MQQTPGDPLKLLELITESMNQHGKLQSVQLAATSCIYCIIIKHVNLPSELLTKIVNSVLNTMKNFPNNLIMLKNCLLILEANNYLFKNCVREFKGNIFKLNLLEYYFLYNKKRFNKFQCINVTLNNMLISNSLNHESILTRACSICSKVILNAEPSYRLKFRQLAEPHHAHVMMNILKETLNNNSDSQLLHNALDIIWALSEGSEEWSTNFITQNCLNVLIMLVEAFADDKVAMFKIMGFIVSSLKEFL